jgi:hypothetical protein
MDAFPPDQADRSTQLRWEAGMGRYAALAAAVVAAFVVASSVVSFAVLGKAANDAQYLQAVDAHPTAWLIAGILLALELLLLPLPLAYLYKVVKYRRPQLPQPALVALIAGGVGLCVLTIVLRATEISSAHDFVIRHTPPQDALKVRQDAVQTISVFGLVASLALAVSMVLISINAIRAGIFSRLMGIIGVVVGALYVVPLSAAAPVLNLFWFGSLVALFTDHWPQGRGPAWASGEAIAWPTPQQRAQQRTDSADVEGKASERRDGPDRTTQTGDNGTDT